ncbi:MAG TPA: ArsA-related P-loop ATPase [Polyangia bacterium]|nr:ArsA-related P-loop ATPase [Polyangia bacterium]
MTDFLAEKRIVVCVGPGGVGKTTTAAALAALAARRGQRTLVTTIDPAPRLADALGVSLVAEPTEVPAAVAGALGIAPGKLHVARLDTERAFGKLVEEQVTDAEMRRRIFENPIYRQITTTLTGSQEYAATLALYDIVRGNQFDLIVLDTPPTANALDFLEAPHRLAEAIASPALQWFARPSGDEGRFSLRRLRSGSAIILKRLAQFVGSQFLEDIAAFLSDFQGVLGGFLARAESVSERLRGSDVAFMLVLAPETPAVDEALFFERRLREAGLHLEAFVANRVHERPGLTDVDELSRHLRARQALAGVSEEDVERLAATLGRAAIDMSRVCDGEDRELARLRAAAPTITLLQVPRLDHDVATLAALSQVGGYLSPDGPPAPSAR